MLDLPLNTYQNPTTEIEQIVADASQAHGLWDYFFTPTVAPDATDPLYTQAKTVVDAMGATFNWHDLTNVIKESFYFVQSHQNLSIEEQKQDVIKIIDYVIDLTDTPYLPDEWSDPVFKLFVPPIIEIISKAFHGQLIPILSDEVPSPETFKIFIQKTKESFSDGFQWSDLGVCIENTIIFVGGFPSLGVEEKKQSVIDILDTIIDITEIPLIPNAIVDPIFKAIIPSLVSFIFDSII